MRTNMAYVALGALLLVASALVPLDWMPYVGLGVLISALALPPRWKPRR